MLHTQTHHVNLGVICLYFGLYLEVLITQNNQIFLHFFYDKNLTGNSHLFMMANNPNPSYNGCRKCFWHGNYQVSHRIILSD